ncbi:MAG: NUDIX domain-containing protein [Brevinematia bacterium]
MIRIRVQAVIFDDTGKLLLAKHSKNGKEYYVLPGGGVEYGERLLDALVRELEEELNISKVFSAKLLDVREFIDSESGRHVLDIYYYVVANLEGVKLSENDGVLVGFDFFDLSELKNINVYPSWYFIENLIKESLGYIIKK